jgi:hypothetical protein
MLLQLLEAIWWVERWVTHWRWNVSVFCTLGAALALVALFHAMVVFFVILAVGLSAGTIWDMRANAWWK